MAQDSAGVPVFAIDPAASTIRFAVKASVPIEGTFDRWKATLKFKSPEVTTGILEVRIQADSVDTGSGLKNRTLKGGDFFDVEHNPLITFKSTRIVQTSYNTFDLDRRLYYTRSDQNREAVSDDFRPGDRVWRN